MAIGVNSSQTDSFRVAAAISFFGVPFVTRVSSAINLLLGCSPSQPSTPCYALAENASPITYASGSNSPLLIFHGGSDPTVPVSMSQLMQATMVNANADSTLVTVPGMGHNLGNVMNGASPHSGGNRVLMGEWIANRLAGCGSRPPSAPVSQAVIDSLQTAQPPSGPCRGWCRTNSNAWRNKCTWTNCRGCTQCNNNQQQGVGGGDQSPPPSPPPSSAQPPPVSASPSVAVAQTAGGGGLSTGAIVGAGGGVLVGIVALIVLVRRRVKTRPTMAGADPFPASGISL